MHTSTLRRTCLKNFAFMAILLSVSSLALASEWQTTGTVVQLSTSTNNVVIQSTLTVQGGEFSIAVTTFVVKEGNAGLGTASPLYLLDILSRPGDQISTRFRGSTSYPIGILFDQGTSFLGIGVDQTGNFRIAQNWSSTSAGTDRFTVLGSGGGTKVGGGYATQNQFEVAGNVAFGSFTGTAAPTDGFIVSGKAGFGTSNPATNLEVEGDAQFGSGVAKSTFTASPGAATYALRLSSGITIANGGPINLTNGGFIQFADGSISTTATSGAGPSTFVGWQQIASSVTLGGSTAITFTVPAASGTYWLSAAFSNGSSNAFTQIRFNSDTGSNYTWVDSGLVRATTLSTFSDSDTSCSWGTNNNTIYNLPANGWAKKNLYFDIPINKSQYAIGTTDSGASDASGGPNEVTSKGTCLYKGTSAVSSVTVLTSAGTFAGTFRLFQVK